MIHCASIELVMAMRGEAPSYQSPPPHLLKSACGRTAYDGVYAWQWIRGRGRMEDAIPVDCPVCVRLMRNATCPARWDFLETLGLAPKLEAK